MRSFSRKSRSACGTKRSNNSIVTVSKSPACVYGSPARNASTCSRLSWRRTRNIPSTIAPSADIKAPPCSSHWRFAIIYSICTSRIGSRSSAPPGRYRHLTTVSMIKTSCNPFAGGRKRCNDRVKLTQQLLLLAFDCFDTRRLDMTITADLFRERGQPDGCAQRHRRQSRQKMLDQHPVVIDESALHPPLFGIAERIERRAAQDLQVCEQREEGHHPGTESELSGRHASGLGLRQRRRRQMKTKREVALELLLQRGDKFRAPIKSGDFILVLVGHQLEQVVSDRLGQQQVAAGNLLLGHRASFDERAVLRGIGYVLVADQVGRALFDQRKPVLGPHRN